MRFGPVPAAVPVPTVPGSTVTGPTGSGTPASGILVALVLLLATGCRPTPPTSQSSPGAESSATRTNSPAFGLDPALLAFTVDAADMHVVSDGTVERVGTSTSTVERATLGNRQVIRLILKQEFSLATSTDTLEIDATTMLPVRFRNSMGEIQSASVDYGADGHVKAVFSRLGEQSMIDTTLAPPFLDGAVFQPLISALPLADGYQARIPVFHFQAGPRIVGVRVVKAGMVPYAGGERPVWFVEYEGAPGRVIVLSIDREDRRMLRAESRIDADRRYVQVTK